MLLFDPLDANLDKFWRKVDGGRAKHQTEAISGTGGDLRKIQRQQ